VGRVTTGVAIVAGLGIVGYVMSQLVYCDETCQYVSHRFEPAREEHWVQNITVGEVTVPIIHTEHIPAKWYETLYDCQGNAHELHVSEVVLQASYKTSLTHQHLRWKMCPCKSEFPLRTNYPLSFVRAWTVGSR
jgi:hypothetical protein